jgi:hypothetical protein
MGSTAVHTPYQHLFFVDPMDPKRLSLPCREQDVFIERRRDTISINSAKSLNSRNLE